MISTFPPNLLPDTGADEAPGSRAKKRRPKRTALFFAFLLGLAAVVGFLWLWVWPATVRREAYLPELEDRVRHDPYDGRLLALVGARQIEAHDYNLAANSLRQAIAAGEGQAVVWLNLAAALEAGGQRPHALANMRLALRSRPQDAEFQAALSRLRQIPVPVPPGGLAPALAPNGPQPLIDTYTQGSFLNGLAQWWGHNRPETSGYTTRALWVQQEPENAQSQRLWGLALMRNRRPQEAEIALRKAVALAPQSPQNHLDLAQCQEKLGKYAFASLQYIETLKLQRDHVPALLGLGRVSQHGGRIGNAVRSFQKATQTAPATVEAWTGLGRAMQLTGLGYDQSAAAYQKAMQLAPGNTDFFNDYAVSLYRNSRQSEAEALVRKRLAAVPNDALSHHLLGMVLMNFNPILERVADAEKHTREALHLNKGNPLSSIQLAQLLFQQNKSLPEAVALLKNAIRFDPYNHSSRLLLARVYRQMGQSTLAAKTAAEADTLFKTQQKIADLAEKERKNQLADQKRRELIRLYKITGQAAKAEHQKEILAVMQADPQAPMRIQDSYAAALDEVLGKARTAMERE